VEETKWCGRPHGAAVRLGMSAPLCSSACRSSDLPPREVIDRFFPSLISRSETTRSLASALPSLRSPRRRARNGTLPASGMGTLVMCPAVSPATRLAFLCNRLRATSSVSIGWHGACSAWRWTRARARRTQYQPEPPPRIGGTRGPTAHRGPRSRSRLRETAALC